MGYPNQLKSARITGGTPIAQGPGKVGEAEQAVADALGIPIDTNFGAKVVVNDSEKGVANGVATLGADGKVPAGQLPSTGAFSGVFAYRATTDQTLVQYANYVQYNAEKFDTAAYHDNTTNPDRLTVPAGKAGYYLIVAQITISGSGGTVAEARLESNLAGSAYQMILAGGSSIKGEFHWVQYLNVGDYVRLMVTCPSAGWLLTFGENNNWIAMSLLGT